MKNKNKLFTVAIISILTAVTIFIINKIIFLTSILKDILQTQEGYKYEWRFGNIYYTKTGAGKPLLLIHDLDPGSSDLEWSKMVENLSKKNTVYTLDLLGYGRSDKPNFTYTNYLYVQLITDFIKNIIGRRTDVITSGSSSSIVIMSSCSDNTLFDKIMSINPDSLNKTNQIPTKKSKLLKFIIETPIIGTLIYNINVNKEVIRKDFSNRYFQNPYRISKNLVNGYYEAAHLGGENSKFLFSSIKGNYLNFSISHKLGQIDNSIYIIGGSQEEDIKQTIYDYKILNSIIEDDLVEGTKHLPHLEKPEEVFKLCEIYLL